jgi:hypothetical protein
MEWVLRLGGKGADGFEMIFVLLSRTPNLTSCAVFVTEHEHWIDDYNKIPNNTLLLKIDASKCEITNDGLKRMYKRKLNLYV